VKPRKATPKTREAMTRAILRNRRGRGKPLVKSDGPIWDFLTGILDESIRVKLAQTAADTR
jgi:hypothetical protein